MAVSSLEGLPIYVKPRKHKIVIKLSTLLTYTAIIGILVICLYHYEDIQRSIHKRLLQDSNGLSTNLANDQTLSGISMDMDKMKLFNQVETLLNLSRSGYLSTEDFDIDLELRKLSGVLKQKIIIAQAQTISYIYTPTDICDDDARMFLLTYVHSAPSHSKLRNFIRTTWGNPSVFKHLRHKVIFVTGKPQVKSEWGIIRNETRYYGDMLVGDFLDTYQNLSLKALVSLKWVSDNCKHVRYVLKTDDDVFVDIFKLVNHIRSLQAQRLIDRRLIMCHTWRTGMPIRDKDNKWYIPVEEYSKPRFPPYCAGMAYVMSPDVVADLYKKMRNAPFIWIDDVYITGILARQLGIRHRPINTLYILEFNRWVRQYFVFAHTHYTSLLKYLWQKSLRER